MSESAAFSADRREHAPAAGDRAGERRWKRPPVWLWGISVGLQVLCAAALTNLSFFLVDDYVFLNQARVDRVDLTYLRLSLYEHFSATSRLLDKLLVVLAPGSWVFAHWVELAIYAAALVAFVFVIRTILGNGWGAFLLTILFGQSLFVIRLLFWWTATANILPSTVFMLVALGCYLRWRDSGSRMMLAGCIVAYALALLDYETALLFPAYVAAVSLLVLEPHPGPRAWVATLWRERWAWIGFVALDAAALVNYYSFYYYPNGMRPSNSEIAHYLSIAFFQTFVPALLGIHYPQPADVTVAAVIVVGGAVGATLYLRPHAWRALLAFIFVFLVTMLPVGLNRVTRHGPTIGGVLYYQQSTQFMFLVFAALALSARWGGKRVGASPRRFAVASRAWQAIAARRPPWGVVAAGGLAIAAVYGALYVTSVQALVGIQRSQAQVDRTFVSRYIASDGRTRAENGVEPVLVDLRVPTAVLKKSVWPYTTYAQFFALFNPRLRVDEIAKPLYVVSSRGSLLPVRFNASAGALVDQATVSPSASAAAAVPAAAVRGAACVPAARSSSWLRLRLTRAEYMTHEPQNLAWVLAVRFRISRTSSVPIELLARTSGRGMQPATQTWDRGSGGEYIPLDFTGPVSEVEFKLPARACVSSLAFGRVNFTHKS